MVADATRISPQFDTPAEIRVVWVATRSTKVPKPDNLTSIYSHTGTAYASQTPLSHALDVHRSQYPLPQCALLIDNTPIMSGKVFSAHLNTSIQRGVCHYDPKPGNMIFSASRGGILISLGTASCSDKGCLEWSKRPAHMPSNFFSPVRRVGSVRDLRRLVLPPSERALADPAPIASPLSLLGQLAPLPATSHPRPKLL